MAHEQSPRKSLTCSWRFASAIQSLDHALWQPASPPFAARVNLFTFAREGLRPRAPWGAIYTSRGVGKGSVQVRQVLVTLYPARARRRRPPPPPPAMPAPQQLSHAAPSQAPAPPVINNGCFA